MLTEEQLKNLKKGDKILVESSVEKVYADGDVQIRVKTRMINNKIGDSLATLSSSCLSLAKPTHDPCRRFKKGDKARVVERYGRTPHCFPPGKIKVGDIVTTAEDESFNFAMYVFIADGSKMAIPWYFLELVTPVEEQLYSVIDSPQTYNIVQAGKKGFIATFYKNHPLAKEGAENHCERLNEEWKWRKNHESNIKENRA